MDPRRGWRPKPGRHRVVPFSVRKPAVPFKHHAEHRHHIPKPRYRVTNWREYDAALRRRGSLTVWFTDDAIAAWRAEPRITPRGQPYYSDLAVTTALTRVRSSTWRDGKRKGSLAPSSRYSGSRSPCRIIRRCAAGARRWFCLRFAGPKPLRSISSWTALALNSAAPVNGSLKSTARLVGGAGVSCI